MLFGLSSAQTPIISNDPLAKARSLLEKNFLDDADHTIREYLSTNPKSAEGHFFLGLILFRKGNPQESLSEYTTGAKFHDPSAFDLKIVALDYVLLADYANADRWLTRSVEMDPQDAKSWYYLGRTKYNENRFDEAIKAFEQCLKLDPGNVKAEDNLGLSYQGLGKIDEALKAYKNAISWQANRLEKTPWPLINIGALLLEQNRPEDAVGYLSQAVEISPQEPKAHEQLGKAYTHLNQLPRAQVELEKAVELNSNSAPLHFMLGQVYRKLGMMEKAKAELDRGAALNASPTRLNPILPPE